VKGEGREGTSGVNAPAIGRSDWRWLHEPCFYAAVEGESVFNLGDRTTTTVWTVTLDTTGRIHPTEKPLGVAELPIKNSSKRGDVVYDGFCGSGTSMLACQNLARKCRAIELNPKYCAVILERMKNAFSITGIKLSHA
jgi:site-specific DNA-methyltransferase (adenine-specific)